jgi:hypothetical protein
VTFPGVSGDYVGLGMSSSNPIQYYVTHHSQCKIFVFDENWNYVSNKSSFPYVNYMIPLGNYLFITGRDNIWKTDQQLNVLLQYNSTSSFPVYRGLYYNSTNNLIYVTSSGFNVIHVFNLYLTLNDTISTTHSPWSINENNNELYVGTLNGLMLVIVNKQIIKQFNGCNKKSVELLSILFDYLNNMATSCADNQLYLYNTTVTYLNKSIPTVSKPMYIGLDSKSRLVVVTYTQITLYN